jgi:cation/acetate symporter
VAGMVVPALIALAARGLDISVLVGWAFALAASTFCPLFLLGIWWRGLTARGAIAGMAAGGLVASSGIVATLVAEPAPTVLGALLAQPAVLSVPVAFATMIGVSLADPERPERTEETMLALHGPEGLGLEAARARG